MRYFNAGILLFALIGVILIAACDSFYKESSYKIVQLDTKDMVEADDSLMDERNGPAALYAYLSKENQSSATDSIPYVDVFVCRSHKRDSIAGDTIIILDRELKPAVPLTGNEYWTGELPAVKRNACKITIPAGQLRVLRKYKYKYARVTLITDD
jgi:hypothetical protein